MLYFDMLTFTHTYLLNLAYRHLHHQNLPLKKVELILGNIIPDFITHLGRSEFQAKAHNINSFISLTTRGLFEWGAIFHILCDNYSTLGRITFDGDYQHHPKNGFIEVLAKNVTFNIPLRIPRRRILQCAFDIFILRHHRSLLIEMLQSAESFLQKNFDTILTQVSVIYKIEFNKLKVGFDRFTRIYGTEFIHKSALETYRLFPLIRSLLNLSTLTDPEVILAEINKHPELMKLVEQNMDLIKNIWSELLTETVQEVLKYPGMIAGFGR